GWHRFEERGFPTTRDEAWRFTSVAPLVRTAFAPVEAGGRPDPDALSAMAFAPDGLRVVFVDGAFVPELSSEKMPDGLRVASLRQALGGDGPTLEPHLAEGAPAESSVFTSLNAALWEDGALVQTAPGAVVTAPVHLVFLSSAGEAPTMSHPRNLVLLGAGS